MKVCPILIEIVLQNLLKKHVGGKEGKIKFKLSKQIREQAQACCAAAKIMGQDFITKENIYLVHSLLKNAFNFQPIKNFIYIYSAQ